MGKWKSHLKNVLQKINILINKNYYYTNKHYQNKVDWNLKMTT